MKEQTLDEKRETLDKFVESACDVRIANKTSGIDGYVVLGFGNGEYGEDPLPNYYHISDDWDALPVKVRHITPFSLNNGNKNPKGIIRIDSDYKGVFG